jgi:UDP-glucose:glycoprotein glucosyltransferase
MLTFIRGTSGRLQGMNMIFINGRQLSLDALTPYSLFEFVKHEMKMMDSMQALGLDTRSSRKILNAPSSDGGEMGEMGGEAAFKLDVYHDEHVFWLNNIEKDDMYRQWPSSLQALLQRGWPGQLRYVRRNLWTAIYMLDPASLEDLQFISEAVNQVNHQLPVRFGFIFKSSAVPPEDASEPASDTAKTKEGESADGQVKKTVPEDEGIAFYRLFSSLYTRHGYKAAFDFADGYFRKAIAVGPEGRRGVLKEVTQGTAKRYRTEKGKTKFARDVKSTASNEALRKSTAFARNSGVAEDGAACVVNGAVLQGDALDEQSLHYLLQTQMVELQRMTYFGQIQEAEDIYKQYINHGGPAHKRFHKLIVPGRDSSTQMVQLTKAAASYTDVVQQLSRLPAAMCGTDTGNARVLTHLVAADMGSKVGCEVVEEAFARLTGSGDDELCKHVRIILVDSSGKHADASEAVSVLQEMMWDSKTTSKLLRTQAHTMCKALHGGTWSHMTSAADFKKLLDKATTRVGSKNLQQTADKDGDAGAMSLVEQWRFSVELFGMEAGATAVATSGRVFAVTNDTSFVSGDFMLSESTEWKDRSEHVSKALELAQWPGVSAEDVTSTYLSNVALVAATVIGQERNERILRRDQVLFLKTPRYIPSCVK